MGREEIAISDYIETLSAASALVGTEKFIGNQSAATVYIAPTDVSTYVGVETYIDTKSADYNVSSTYRNYFGLVTAGSSADVTATLPDPANVSGYMFTIMKADAGTKNVIIDRADGTINGQTTVELVSQYDYLKVVSDGSNYYVVDFLISYETGMTNISDWTNAELSASHNMNVNIDKIEARLIISTDSDIANGRETGLCVTVLATDDKRFGTILFQDDTDTIHIQTGVDGVFYLEDDGTGQVIDNENYYYNLLIKRWKI